MPETFMYSPRKDHQLQPRQKDAGDSTHLQYYNKLMSCTGVVQLSRGMASGLANVTGVVGFFAVSTLT